MRLFPKESYSNLNLDPNSGILEKADPNGVRIISHRRFGSSNTVEDLLENINNTAKFSEKFHIL